ncbi:hypothetical protein SAMN05518861_10785 [Mesorhizobium sp. YR577]|nr:hypothetical protein SAMN05518861_10785 [Mesorhizobium sp. YR577]
MNPFLLTRLDADELLALANCLNEVREALNNESEFHTRVGVSLDFAEKLHRELRGEMDRRKAQGDVFFR